MSLPISDFQGEYIYLDTMIFYAFLRGSDEGARKLFKSIEAGELQAYTSALTFDELAYRLLLALIRDKYRKSPLDRLRSDRKGMISEFYETVKSQLTDMQNLPHLTISDVTSAEIDAMHQNCSEHSLLPRDAIHLATMQKYGCSALVSLDSDFDRVSDIQRYIL